MNTKIKLKAKNVIELLKKLNKDLETTCTLELDLEVSKTMIKILDNYSEDWNFIDSGEFEEKDNTKKPSDTYEDNSGNLFYTSCLSIKTYNDLATLLEAIFKLCKTSPNIKFESGLFYNTLEIEYHNVASDKNNLIEHYLIRMIIESYYGDSKIEDAIEDTVGKLKGMWISKELSAHPGVTSVTKILYGGKK